VNSVSGICLTKLDVLDGMDEVKVCVGYKKAGSDCTIPMHSDDYDGLEPVYETLPGWSESTVGAKSLEDLPANAKAYIEYVEKAIGAPIDIISTGPDRSETIVKRDPFNA